MHFIRAICVLAAGLVTSAASAGDFVVGLGAADFDDTAITAFELEYHTDPIWRFRVADVSVAGAAVVYDEGNFFVGVGVSAIRNLKNNWFIEASFMPGYYDSNGPETELGNDLEFRSMIGLGREFSKGVRMSVGLSHISNGGLGDSNPGANALTLRFRF
jgi:hypothetical protein